jgi:hypothetical protein
MADEKDEDDSIQYGSEIGRSILAGAEKFKIVEIEVFRVIFL